MENISSALLDWFYKTTASCPSAPTPAPTMWLSEIMLQQTRVSAALPYYERFLAALPDIPALAACEEEKLHKLWEGLGYYSRVRNLQKAARIVCEQYGGQLPADYDALRALPGIGDYTAGAVASISFGIPVPAVDGNVLRVFSRLYNDPAVVTEPAVKRPLRPESWSTSRRMRPATTIRPLWSWEHWSACRTVRLCAKNARSPTCAPLVLRALHWSCPAKQRPSPADCSL